MIFFLLDKHKGSNNIAYLYPPPHNKTIKQKKQGKRGGKKKVLLTIPANVNGSAPVKSFHEVSMEYCSGGIS